jgi:hypothetical protein
MSDDRNLVTVVEEINTANAIYNSNILPTRTHQSLTEPLLHPR